MKKFVFVITLLFGFINGYSQTFKTVKNDYDDYFNSYYFASDYIIYNQKVKTIRVDNPEIDLLKYVKTVKDENGEIYIPDADITFSLKQDYDYEGGYRGKPKSFIYFDITIRKEDEDEDVFELISFPVVTGRIIRNTEKTIYYVIDKYNYYCCKLMFDKATETWNIDLRITKK